MRPQDDWPIVKAKMNRASDIADRITRMRIDKVGMMAKAAGVNYASMGNAWACGYNGIPWQDVDYEKLNRAMVERDKIFKADHLARQYRMRILSEYHQREREYAEMERMALRRTGARSQEMVEHAVG